MPIYQKGTSSWTTVNDMYICTGASAFTRICKVYICTGANTFTLVYDGCGFACDGYFVSGTCLGTDPVNYAGYPDGGNHSSSISAGTYDYKNGDIYYWNMNTYQCASCPPQGHIFIEYQTCEGSTGNISPFLFVNRELNTLGTFTGSDLSSYSNLIVSSLNAYMPLINNVGTSGSLGNDPGICCCTDQEDWKLPGDFCYTLSETGGCTYEYDSGTNSTWSCGTPTCNETTGFQENNIFSYANYSQTFTSKGVFWGGYQLNTDNTDGCPIYCYGSSGKSVDGFACKSVARIPIILRQKNSNDFNYGSTIKYNNNNTVQSAHSFYRLYNFGFGVKSSGSVKWKLKITYPVYFSAKELTDLYDLIETTDYTLGNSYTWTKLFNNNTNGVKYFDLLMTKPLPTFIMDYQGSSQTNLYNSYFYRTTTVSSGAAITSYEGDSTTPSTNNSALTNKPIYCLSIEIKGDSTGICSAALYSSTDSNRTIKLEPMTDSSGNLKEFYEMFAVSSSNSVSDLINNNMQWIEGVDPSLNHSPASHFFYETSGDATPALPTAIDYIKNYWGYTQDNPLNNVTNTGTCS